MVLHRKDDIATFAHSLEDLFFFLCEQKPSNIDCSTLSDLVLEGSDFIKLELEKIKNGDNADGDNASLISNINKVLEELKQQNMPAPGQQTASSKNSRKQQYYLSKDARTLKKNLNMFKAVVFFQDGCEMENIRAYAIVHHLKDKHKRFTTFLRILLMMIIALLLSESMALLF